MKIKVTGRSVRKIIQKTAKDKDYTFSVKQSMNLEPSSSYFSAEMYRYWPTWVIAKKHFF